MSRSHPRRTRLRAALTTAALVVATGLTGACAAENPTTPTTTQAPGTTGATQGTAAPGAATTIDPDDVDTVVEPVAVPFWIRGTVVGNGAARPLPPDVDKVRFALDQLLAGPTPEEEAAGLRTLIRADTTVLSFEVVDGIAKVGFNRAFQSEQTRPQVAQVVFTLTQFPTVERVQFQIDGEVPEGLGGEGLPTAYDGRDAFDDVLPRILPESPTPYEKISSPLTVSGLANTFEATVRWSVSTTEGSLLEEGFTTATAGSGTWGTFELTTDLPAYEGSVVLTLWQDSMEDGGDRLDVYEVIFVLS
ncbi:MAG: GerMN domain-containing protein [Acidimicrobiales bacterium]|nr:GerMN domain-containing protein [Acidimicrobiales bacterium]